ncbi:IclR family transcriptional regulator [Allopusillimonas ginsengisoli]|uniref:IclR family transcriptional regulator n=1 Tax=Allopusillimonas ginsengisoli TaxID=453575 RepID=UPI00101ED83F|nr:IclR family transcriptional regulator C-terminal domain-containing protein [Allopusillimonas ginsengisoli]TEA74264.1 IclR family transcriptional regulator [Allopusillimonas ginsengisoli]
MATQEADTTGPKTFARGLLIMDVMHRAGGDGLKVAEIARQTGVQRTTVYRFLDVLVEQGYLLEPDAQRRYVFNYARFAASSTLAGTIEQLKPVLQRISAQTGDSSFLIRREDGDSLCVHRELGSYPVQVLTVTIGYRQPLGVGAAGLALLSNLADDDIELVLAANDKKLVRFGGMTASQMRRLIQNTRERGWSAVGNAAVPGVMGVGVPILRHSGAPIFAVSVSSVMNRMPLKRQRFIIDVIRRELEAVST